MWRIGQPIGTRIRCVPPSTAVGTARFDVADYALLGGGGHQNTGEPPEETADDQPEDTMQLHAPSAACHGGRCCPTRLRPA